MQADTRLLSSSWTPVMKFVFPFFFGIIYLIATITIVSVAFTSEIDFKTILILLFGFVLALSVGIWVLFRFCLHLKKVTLVQDYLLISNYRQTIQIPLSEIEQVRQFLFLNPPLLTIYLKSPSKFGSKIEFLAYTRVWDFFSNHPTYLLLQELSAKKGVYQL